VKYREELIRNISLLDVSVWGRQYIDEQILNITVLVVRVWGV